MSTVIAIIGTRKYDALPPGTRNDIFNAARNVAYVGGVVRTGAAPGVDQVAAEAALSWSGSRVQLVLPWESYEASWVASVRDEYGDLVTVETYDHQPEWAEGAFKYHPNPDALAANWTWLKLHARNYGIVSGAAAVVAVPHGKNLGGTGQGIRVAEGLGRPLFDFTRNLTGNDADAFARWLRGFTPSMQHRDGGA